MPAADGSLDRSQELLLEQIFRMALARAKGRTDPDEAADVAQSIAIYCMHRMEAGTWKIRDDALERFVNCAVRRKLIGLDRSRERNLGRDAEHYSRPVFLVSSSLHPA